MPLPLAWIVGATAVAVGGAIAAAISDDDSSSKRSYSDDSEQQKQKAEQQRKEKAFEDKLEAKRVLFAEEGLARAHELQQALAGQMRVELLGENPFKATLESKNPALINPSYVNVHNLQFLSKHTQKRLNQFESLYDVEFEPEAELVECGVRLQELNTQIKQLKKLRQQLELHKTKLHS